MGSGDTPVLEPGERENIIFSPKKYILDIITCLATFSHCCLGTFWHCCLGTLLHKIIIRLESWENLSLSTCTPVWAHCDTAVWGRWSTPALGQSWALVCTPDGARSGTPGGARCCIAVWEHSGTAVLEHFWNVHQKLKESEEESERFSYLHSCLGTLLQTWRGMFWQTCSGTLIGT